MQKITFKYLFNNIYNFSEDSSVFASESNWNLDDNCLLVPEEEIDVDLNPIDTFHYAFGIHTLIDVLGNLKVQKEDYNEEEALTAIKYYLNNDSFINILD